MSRLSKVFLFLGLAVFIFLARKMSLATAAWAFRAVGWGLLFLLAQELIAHVLNTLGWRVCLDPEHRPPLPRLTRLRIIGEALNYLVPSAAVAGEWTKTALLGDDIPLPRRLSGTVMAKLVQTFAMTLTAGIGLAVILAWGDGLGGMRPQAVLGLGALIGLAALLIALGIFLASGTSGRWEGLLSQWVKWGGLKETAQAAREMLRERPGDLALGTAFFCLAYLWGAFEGYWICRFLRAPVGALTAVKIEILSIFLDSALFFVPAKAGTQESTKTLIFLALGRPAAQGFAFGLIRHFRELCWAGGGLLLSRFPSHEKPLPAKEPRREPPPAACLEAKSA